MLIRTVLILAALMTALVALPALAAPALTTKQIETAWSEVHQQSGSFTQTYDDGSKQTGTYYVYDPTLIIMTYDAHAAIVAMNGVSSQRTVALPDGRKIQVSGKQLAVIDPGFETVTNSLGVFAKLLSAQPDIDELVTGGGDNASVTVVRLRHPQAQQRGHVDLTFDNATRQLEKWESNIDGEHVVTEFN